MCLEVYFNTIVHACVPLHIWVSPHVIDQLLLDLPCLKSSPMSQISQYNGLDVSLHVA